MYSVVLMVAMSGGADVQAGLFSHKSCNGCSGCHGVVVVDSGCHGCGGCHGVSYGCCGSSCHGVSYGCCGSSCHGSKHHGGSKHGCCGGGGLFSRMRGKHGSHGCCGSSCHGCCGVSYGCCGSSCHGVSYGCCGSSCHGVSSYGCCGGVSYGCCGAASTGGCFGGCDGAVISPAAPVVGGSVIEGAPVAPVTGEKIIEKPVEGKKIEKPKTEKKIEKPEDNLSSADAPATIVVTLPADAKLTIDGVATTSVAARRVFQSPALEAGKLFRYNLSAEISHEGKSVVVNKEVRVEAGATVEVSLNGADLAVASR